MSSPRSFGGPARARPRGRAASVRCFAATAAIVLTSAAVVAGGCSQACCTTDGFPIALAGPTSSGPDAAGLRMRVQYPGGDPSGVVTEPIFNMSVDTGSALTFVRRNAQMNQRPQMILRSFDVLDARGDSALRAMFRDIEVLPIDLDAAAGFDAILGGSFLRNFSVQLDFGGSSGRLPTLTFWTRQDASEGFLSSAGFAVFQFNLLGGAELTARSRPDFFGLTGPVDVPATRVILRACGAPRPFDPEGASQEMCCKRGDEVALASGADLALVMATGVGPLVLSESAWQRVLGTQISDDMPEPMPVPLPDPPSGLRIPSLPAAITDAVWYMLPRLALVDQEADDASNPGPCVELGRARRLRWVEYHQTAADGHHPACAQPCDTDPRDATRSMNAAAYLEIGDAIPVAVVPDGAAFLQGLRAEIRPEGPEIDGLIGAGVLRNTAAEIDYRQNPSRAIFSCAPGTTSTACVTAPRCPRLASAGDVRACYGQPEHALPTVCEPSGCG